MVLGLLSIIALCALVVVYGLDRSLEAMTKRLENAINSLRKRDEEAARTAR